MRKKSSGEIYKIFLDADNDTVIRKVNIRQFVERYNLDYVISQKRWLINLDSVLEALNPKDIQEPQIFPRMRSKKTALEEWNKNHRKKIKHHIIDKVCESGKVFVYHSGRHNVINYDQLEKELTKILKEKEEY